MLSFRDHETEQATRGHAWIADHVEHTDDLVSMVCELDATLTVIALDESSGGRNAGTGSGAAAATRCCTCMCVCAVEESRSWLPAGSSRRVAAPAPARVRVQWQSWLLSLIFAWLIELAAFANAISSCVENIFLPRAVVARRARALHDRRVCLTSVAVPHRQGINSDGFESLSLSLSLSLS